MISYFGIVKNTILYSIRSFIFQTLFVILIICSVCLPYVLTGDGTPFSHIKITIDYTIFLNGFILTLSSLWLSCTIMNFDMDHYQMHMVSVKPVKKSTIWLGKFSGLLTIHLILLFACFFLFYIVLMFDLKTSNYSHENLKALQEKILIGREKSYPALSIDKIYNEKWRKKEKELEEKGKILTKVEQEKQKITTFYQTMTQEGETEPKKNKTFKFQNLYKIKSSNITLKFRIFIGDINAFDKQKKPTAKCSWEIKNPKTNKFDMINDSDKKYFSNIFYEINLPDGYINNNGEITLRFKNHSGTSVFFQLNEAPLFLIAKASFFENYTRAFIISVLYLVFVLCLGCAFGSIFSFPIAVFTVVSYLLIGSISNFVIETESSNHIKSKNFGNSLSSTLLQVIIPIQKFQCSEKLSSGSIFSYKEIWELIFKVILLKELPLVFMCIYLYSKKEPGLVIKK